MKTTFGVMVMMLSLDCCAQQQSFHWMVGTWKLEGKNIYEVWHINGGEKTLEGTSFMIKGSDTVVTEVISIQFYEGTFHYIPDVAGDQPPVDFKFTSHDDYGF